MHDDSFEKQGAPNPIVLVEQVVKDFVFLPTYCADLIVGGVVCRIFHGASGRTYSRSYPIQVYVRDLLDSGGEHIYVKARKYRLRFLQAGHWHTEISFQAAGIHVTASGNWQLPTDFTIRRGLVGPQGGRFVDAIIEDGIVTEYTSTFVKPRRGR